MSDKLPKDDEDESAYEARMDKATNARRLNGPEATPIFAGFMMAAMASGRSAKGAANEAELAMVELKKRFT